MFGHWSLCSQSVDDTLGGYESHGKIFSLDSAGNLDFTTKIQAKFWISTISSDRLPFFEVLGDVGMKNPDFAGVKSRDLKNPDFMSEKSRLCQKNPENARNCQI